MPDRTRTQGSFLLRRSLILREGLFAGAAALFADTVRHGLLLSFVLCTVTALAVLVTAAMPKRLPMLPRTVLYSVTAALVYIPAVLAAEQIFSAAEVRAAGTALPILITGLLYSRHCPALIRPARYVQMLPQLLGALIGAAFAVMLCAALRELLGSGSVSGMQVFSSAPVPFLRQPFGGLILLTLTGVLLVPRAEKEAHHAE